MFTLKGISVGFTTLLFGMFVLVNPVYATETGLCRFDGKNWNYVWDIRKDGDITYAGPSGGNFWEQAHKWCKEKPKPTSTPTATPTATPTVTPSATPRVTPTPTATPTVAPTATPVVDPSTTPSPTPVTTTVSVSDGRSDGSQDALDCVPGTQSGRKDCNTVKAGMLPNTGNETLIVGLILSALGVLAGASARVYATRYEAKRHRAKQ